MLHPSSLSQTLGACIRLLHVSGCYVFIKLALMVLGFLLRFLY